MKEAVHESIRVTKVNSLMAAGTNNGGVFLKFGCKKKQIEAENMRFDK